MFSRSSVALVLALCAAIASATGAEAGPAGVATVCHQTEDGVRAIAVGESAARGHREHGDDVVGDEVPASDALVVGADCLPVPVFTEQNCPTAVPAAEGLAPFYEQYCDVRGIPLVSSGRVDPAVLRHAAVQLWAMLQHRPDVAQALSDSIVRVGVMSRHEVTLDMPEWSDLDPFYNQRARGLGATVSRPLVGGAEENVACFPAGDIPDGDRYHGEDIFLHELAHSIHQFGANTVDPGFDGRVAAAFSSAWQRGLWSDTYAMANRHEYFAEGVQSFFDANQRPQWGIHNAVDTREELRSYDPALFDLVAEIYGETTWRPTCPDGTPR